MSRPHDLRWTGSLALGPWWLLYTGAVGPTAEHRHHAVQVLAGADPITVTVGAETTTAHMVVIPANTSHRIVTGSARATVVFVDGDVEHHVNPAAGSESARPRAFRSDPEEMSYAEAVSAAEVLLSSIGARRAAPEPLSPEIARSTNLLGDDLSVSAVGVAAQVGLSPSEFSRRFTREVGLPFRSYRKWRRLLLAIEALASGSNLTAAAHAAGFADSAHFTRTFTSMFGIAPSDLTATSRWLPAE